MSKSSTQKPRIPKGSAQIVVSNVPSDLIAGIDRLAEIEDRPRSAVVRRLLKKVVDQEEAALKQAQPA